MLKVIADWLLIAVPTAVLFFLASHAFGAGQWEPRLILDPTTDEVCSTMAPEWATQVYLYEDDFTYALYDLNGVKPFNPAATYYNCPKWAYPPRKRGR